MRESEKERESERLKERESEREIDREKERESEREIDREKKRERKGRCVCRGGGEVLNEVEPERDRRNSDEQLQGKTGIY